MHGSDPVTWRVKRVGPLAAKRSRFGVANSVPAVRAEHVAVQRVEQDHHDVLRHRHDAMFPRRADGPAPKGGAFTEVTTAR